MAVSCQRRNEDGSEEGEWPLSEAVLLPPDQHIHQELLLQVALSYSPLHVVFYMKNPVHFQDLRITDFLSVVSPPPTV